MKPFKTKSGSIRWFEQKLSVPLTPTVRASFTGNSSQIFASRLASTKSTHFTMADYNRWTKNDLIKRVKELELKLKSSGQNGQSQPPSTSNALTTKSQNGALQWDQPTKTKPRTQKALDPSKYTTRFIALKFAYIGKNYNGFEYQSSGLLPTIEEELWKALVKARLIFPNPERPNEVDWNVCEYSKCGRTDRGVSAFGQVVGLRVRGNKPTKRKADAADAAAAAAAAAPVAGDGASNTEDTIQAEGKDVVKTDTVEEAKEEILEEDDGTPLPVEQEIQYCRVLNRLLPPDIKAYAWCPNPPPDFSARFSCRERQYRYFFTQPAFSPLPNFLDIARPSSSENPKDGWLDIDAMREAAKLFEGLHDFRNFCKIDPSKQITNFHRRIFEADIVEVDGLDTSLPYLAGPQFRREPTTTTTVTADMTCPKVYYFHVRGSGFLWHQIRCMIAVLFLVGQGFEKPSIVAELLDTVKTPQRPNYTLADDAPLVLWDCIFGRENEQGAADEVDWLYVGGKHDNPMSLHASSGLASDLWAYWREKKMDEILANRLLDWISQKTVMQEGPPEGFDKAEITGKMATGSRVFEGGTGPKLTGAYVPVMKRDMIQSPEHLNDRYAIRKGFKSAEEMRALGNWREAIREKEAKEKEARANTVVE